MAYNEDYEETFVTFTYFSDIFESASLINIDHLVAHNYSTINQKPWIILMYISSMLEKYVVAMALKSAHWAGKMANIYPHIFRLQLC